MPDVSQAREPGVPQDVLHHGGQVVLSQLVDGEAPEGAVVGVHEARGVDVIPTVPVRGVMILALDPDPERKIFSFFIIPYQDLDPVRSGIIKLLEVL